MTRKQTLMSGRRGVERKSQLLHNHLRTSLVFGKKKKVLPRKKGGEEGLPCTG